jgi:hypothetical protein
LSPAKEREGCLNSLGAGGKLTASGVSSLSNDSLVLSGAHMPDAAVLYFQGTTPTAQSFGDGLRCAAGTVIRLAQKINASGASSYPEPGDAHVSVRGVIAAPGTFHYQGWYRNAASFCTPQTFNLTNGVLVEWHP